MAPGENGKLSGMVSTIAENRPYEFISIKHLGVVENGIEDTTSEKVKSWVDAFENYTFRESNGVTNLEINMDSDDEYIDMFNKMWPKALGKLKEI